MPSERSLVQWGGVGVGAHGVVTAGVFSTFEEEPDDFGMAELGCVGQCQVTFFWGCLSEQSSGFANPPSRGGERQCHPCSSPKQGVDSLELSMAQCWHHGALRVGAIVA